MKIKVKYQNKVDALEMPAAACSKKKKKIVLNRTSHFQMNFDGRNDFFFFFLNGWRNENHFLK